jgi:uncharacterized protein
MILRTGRVVRQLVRASSQCPRLTLLLSLGCAALAIAYTAGRLRFEASTLHLLPPGRPYVARYRQYSAEFGELDDMVVVVQGRTLAESKAYAARLVHELSQSPIRFHRLVYRINPTHFERRALLYLSLDELREIRERIFDHQEFIEDFARAPTLDRLVEGVNREVGSAFVNEFFDLGLADKGFGGNPGFLRDLLGQISARLERPSPYRSPWGGFFSFGSPDADAGYFVSDDGSLLFILADPVGQKGSFTNDQSAIEMIRQYIARLRAEFPHVSVGVTGGPTLSNDEMSTAFADSEKATVLAFALTLGLLFLGFRRAVKPLLMLGALAVSLAWSMGLITLTVGHLTVFSVMFISIVVGIGINYGIYFLFRYEEEIRLGRSLSEALELTAARTGPGILLGAAMAMVTFYALMLTEFHGIQEFGFVAGTALLMSMLAMLTLFPALLVLVDRRSVVRAPEIERPGVPLVERLVCYPKTILVGAGLLTAFSLWSIRTVGFDFNVLHLQAKATESVIWEQKILATAERSGFSALASATSLDELRRKQADFERLASVSGVDSALMLIPDRQAEKIKIVRDFSPLVAPVRLARPQALHLDRFTAALASLKRRFDIAAGEAGPEGPGLEVQAVRAQIGALLDKLDRAEPERVQVALGDYQAQLYRDFHDKLDTLQRNLFPQPVAPEDVPDELRRKFIGASGRFLLQIRPRVNIWDRSGATRFVEELRSVDPDVTGTPIITYESIRLMEQAYLQGTVYALVLVSGLSVLLLRRLRESVLAVVPLLLGTLWLAGLMRTFDLKFNLANVWGLPLIIGTAAEFGLNVVIRSMEARTHGGPLLPRSTVMAVLLNGLTTAGGFGSLLVAHHQGIRSLGLLLTIGSGACLASSLLVLPVLIRSFDQAEGVVTAERVRSLGRESGGLPPATARPPTTGRGVGRRAGGA